MIGGILEKLGAVLTAPLVAIHLALATEEQKAEYEQTGQLPVGYILGGTMVVTIGLFYALVKLKVLKPGWVTKVKTRYRKTMPRRRK